MSADEQLSLQFADQIAKKAPKPPAPLPTKGHIAGIGHVRIGEYHGDGRFMVYDRQDNRRLVHRDRISFRK